MALFKRKKRLSDYVEGEHKDLLEEALARHRFAANADEQQRELEIDDLRFCDPASQWPDDIKAQRDAEGRPCLTVDRLGPFVHQVVNETRQGRPQPQVNPVGDGASKETAEILQGMIRHIAYMSNGDVAIDTAFESMIRCGRGYFRVLTEYAGPETFEQDIVIKRVPNPHMVYMDPSFTEPDGSDAEWGFVGSWMSKEAYQKEYPDSKLAQLDPAAWQSIGDETPEWAQEDGVLVVEYFRKVRKPVTVYLLEDGSTTQEEPEPVLDENGNETGEKPYKDKRTAMVPEVQWFKLNAVEILDQTVWPGKHIPIVPVLGNELIVEGNRTWSGLVRSAKDAQRAFNYWKSAQAEAIALAPRAPFIGPKGFMGSMRNLWMAANKRPIAALEYEPYDSQNRPLQPPQRNVVEPPIMAITNAMVGAVDDLKATTGMYDPSLGNRESSQSGVAIRQLQRQGQVGNYHFQDNLARSIRHLGRILIDLIPKIYDTQRVVRIVKPDETTDLATINGPTQDPKTGLMKVYDVTVGTYDVTVSVGPGYQTKRQENLALLESMLQGPMGQVLAQVAPDLVVSMMDFAIAQELQERLKKALPPQFQDQTEGQQPVPPQFQAQMQQLMQQHEQLTEALNAAQQEIEQQTAKVQAELQKAQLDAQTKLQIARMNNETELLKVQAQIDAKAADQGLQDRLAQLQAEQADLQELALALHEHMAQMAQHEAGEEPEKEEPEEKPAAGPDPMHEVLKGHSAALEGIAAALNRMSGKKKLITDPKTGAPVGIAPDEDE